MFILILFIFLKVFFYLKFNFKIKNFINFLSQINIKFLMSKKAKEIQKLTA